MELLLIILLIQTSGAQLDIQSQINNAKDALNNSTSQVNLIQNVISAAENGVNQICKHLKTVIEQLVKQVQETLTNLSPEIRKCVQHAVQTLQKIPNEAFDKLTSCIREKGEVGVVLSKNLTETINNYLGVIGTVERRLMQCSTKLTFLICDAQTLADAAFDVAQITLTLPRLASKAISFVQTFPVEFAACQATKTAEIGTAVAKGFLSISKCAVTTVLP